MIFHHPNGRAIKEKRGTFDATDGVTVNLGFIPDAVWITDGALSSDYEGNAALVGAGGNFKEAGKANLLIGMWLPNGDANDTYYVRDVFLYQTDNGFKVAFVTYDESLKLTTNPTKTYTYHAMKYS